MKVFISVLLPAMILLFLSSCTRMVYIGKKVDPEIVLHNEHHNIAFINLFDYTSSTNVKQKEGESYHAGVNALIDGLSSFSNDSTFSFSIADTLKKGVEKGMLTTLYPVDSVAIICNRNKSNLLLTLDSMSINFEWETVVDNDDEGNISKTKNFYLNTKYFLTLYSADGALIDRSNLDQSSYYRSRPTLTGIITIKPSLQRAIGEIESLSYQNGLDYVDKFYPQIIENARRLYTGKAFRESNDYIFTKNWNKATELLEQLVNNPDPAIAEKARYNLEIVKEASEAGAR